MRHTAVSRTATPTGEATPMSYANALAFNRTCPPGTPVVITLRDGRTLNGKTKKPASVWADVALVEVEGRPGLWTVEAVKTSTQAAIGQT